MNLPTISVIGLGYIGLPTASLLATKGFRVHGMDVNQNIVDNLNQGKVTIYEPALDVMVRSAVNSGNLTAHLAPEPADVFIIAVPTPFKDGYAPDLSHVEQASAAIAPLLAPGNLVVLESTSPVGTTEMVGRIIADQRPDLTVCYRSNGLCAGSGPKVYVAHCPERVLPGKILRELVENDRIVGGVDSVSTAAAKDFYKHFVAGKVLTTDSRTAELAKLVENAYRDVNIAFANELSLICDRMEINVWELIELANHHPRVNILQPGPGVGGHCIAVDPWFIVHAQPELARLMRMAREVNDQKPRYVVDKILDKAQRFKHPVIACLGLSYKADVDDLRESPAINIVKQLLAQVEADLLIVEPFIDELPEALHTRLAPARLTPLEQALEQADILVFLVPHTPFQSLTAVNLKDKIVLDFVNALR